MQKCILLLKQFLCLASTYFTYVCSTLVCLLLRDLASFIAVQPEFTGIKTKHEIITSRPLRRNYTCFPFCWLHCCHLSFHQFTNHNEHFKDWGGLCSVWMPSKPVSSDVSDFQKSFGELSVACHLHDLHGQIKKRKWTMKRSYSCLVLFLLISSLFKHQTLVNIQQIEKLKQCFCRHPDM